MGNRVLHKAKNTSTMTPCPRIASQVGLALEQRSYKMQNSQAQCIARIRFEIAGLNTSISERRAAVATYHDDGLFELYSSAMATDYAALQVYQNKLAELVAKANATEADQLAIDAEYYAANAAANNWEEEARQYLDNCELGDYLSLADDY
jgi:hypothetical protein